MVSSLIEIIIQFAFLAVFVVPYILYLLTLQNTLRAISLESRLLDPGKVWLMLIPLFNLYWQFILVDRISRSIGDEFARLNIPHNDSNPTYGVGLTMCIFNCLFWIPILGLFGSMISWIFHWIKVAEFKNRISANQFNFTLDAERNIFYGDNEHADGKSEV